MRNSPLKSFAKKADYKLKSAKVSKLKINKNISFTGHKSNSKKFSDVIPTGAMGNISATYRPTKTLTLRGHAGGSFSTINKSTSSGGSLSLHKKGKKGGFNIGVSKQKGSKPSFTLGGHINL